MRKADIPAGGGRRSHRRVDPHSPQNAPAFAALIDLEGASCNEEYPGAGQHSARANSGKAGAHQGNAGAAASISVDPAYSFALIVNIAFHPELSGGFQAALSPQSSISLGTIRRFPG